MPSSGLIFTVANPEAQTRQVGDSKDFIAHVNLFAKP